MHVNAVGLSLLNKLIATQSIVIKVFLARGHKAPRHQPRLALLQVQHLGCDFRPCHHRRGDLAEPGDPSLSTETRCYETQYATLIRYNVLGVIIGVLGDN